MTQIINASGNPGLLKSQVGIAVLVDSNGNVIETLGGAFSGVQSVNSVTGAVIITGVGGVSVTTAGQTITVSGVPSGVSGPGSSTNLAIAVWNGTTGDVLANTDIRIPSAGLLQGNSLIVDSVGDNTLSATGDIILDAGTNKEINFRDVATPLGSGIGNIGKSTSPFGKVFSNQYATTFKTATGGNISVNWDEGVSQKLDFTGVAAGTYTIGLQSGIPGSAYVLVVKNNGSGTVNLAWSGSQLAWQLGVSGITTASGAALDMFSFVCDSTNHYLGTFSNNYF